MTTLDQLTCGKCGATYHEPRDPNVFKFQNRCPACLIKSLPDQPVKAGIPRVSIKTMTPSEQHTSEKIRSRVEALEDSVRRQLYNIILGRGGYK